MVPPLYWMPVRQGRIPDLRGEIDRRWYRLLSERTEATLSWGILLGVRPTKLAMQKRMEGWEAGAFLDWFQKEYLVSEEKAKLAWEIAGREAKILEKLDLENGLQSLYRDSLLPHSLQLLFFQFRGAFGLAGPGRRLSGPLCAWNWDFWQTGPGIRSWTQSISAEGRPRPLVLPSWNGSCLLLTSGSTEGGYWNIPWKPAVRIRLRKRSFQVLKKHGVTRISINSADHAAENAGSGGKKTYCAGHGRGVPDGEASGIWTISIWI